MLLKICFCLVALVFYVLMAGAVKTWCSRNFKRETGFAREANILRNFASLFWPAFIVFMLILGLYYLPEVIINKKIYAYRKI